jgi:hypothetical protein
MKFFRACGDNVQISADGSRASRRCRREFNNGVVFGDKPLVPGVAVTLRVLDVVRIEVLSTVKVNEFSKPFSVNHIQLTSFS